MLHTLFIAQLAFILMFSLSILHKLSNIQLFVGKVEELSPRLAKLSVFLLILQELIILILFFQEAHFKSAIIWAVVLIAVYTMIVVLMTKYVSVSGCECFGLKAISEALPGASNYLIRNLLIILFSIWILVEFQAYEGRAYPDGAIAMLYKLNAFLLAVIMHMVSRFVALKKDVRDMMVFMRRFNFRPAGHTHINKKVEDHTFDLLPSGSIKLSKLMPNHDEKCIFVFLAKGCRGCEAAYAALSSAPKMSANLVYVVNDMNYANEITDKGVNSKILVDVKHEFARSIDIANFPSAICINHSLFAVSDAAVGAPQIKRLVDHFKSTSVSSPWRILPSY